MRSRVLSAETVTGTDTASFRHSFVVYVGGEVSSYEETRGTTSDGPSRSDKGGGGDGEGDGVSAIPSIMAEESFGQDDECAKSATSLCFARFA
eukprot:60194-Prorocentrum_lima.AAC.1